MALHPKERDPREDRWIVRGSLSSATATTWRRLARRAAFTDSGRPGRSGPAGHDPLALSWADGVEQRALCRSDRQSAVLVASRLKADDRPLKTGSPWLAARSGS